MSASVRTFGKYLLDEEIARGGMSRVFSARLRGLGGFEKRLVVKQVLPELARDPRFVSMFVHEAKTLVQMSHPHIAPVYELGVVDGVYFLAMELVEGATLAQILRDGPLAPGLVAHLGAELCDALHYAHSRFGIVHRDVTPRNVIVDAAGHSRLLDFGIAAPLSDEESEVFGTPGYLSPEQLEGGALGPASDVFGLGAVLFEALTGRRAFDARTVDDMRAALASEGPRFDEDDVPDPLASIVLRTLARDADERPESARELGRALRLWSASAHPEGVAPELGVRAERAEREERRRLSIEPSEREAEHATHEVRTIATSRALDAMLESDAASEPAGTVRIEGRRSAPGEARADADTASDESGPETNADAELDALAASDVHTARATASQRERATTTRAQAEEDEVDATRADEDDATSDAARETHTTHAANDDRAHAAHATRDNRASSRALPWVLGAALVGTLAVLALRPPAADAPIEHPTPPVAEPPPPEPPDPEPPPPMPQPEITEEAHAPPPPEAPPPAPRASVAVSINASPWADVRLDGRPLGRTPQRRVMVRAGHHTLELSCPPLGRQLRHPFDVEAGAPLTLVADLEHDPPTIRSR